MIIKEIFPTSGSIYVDGKPLNKSKTDYFSYVPQYEPNPLNQTPYQALQFYSILKGHSISEAKHAIIDALVKTKLSKNSNRPIGKLSGGNKRKVALAVSLMMDRDLMLLDEPTTRVDIANCKDIWKAIKEIKDKKTVIITSHSMQESEYLAQKLAILIKGKLITFNTKEQIKEEFGTVYDVEIELKKQYEDQKQEEQSILMSIELITNKLKQIFEKIEVNRKSIHRFNLFVPKKEITISNLIRNFEELREEGNINEFFVSEIGIEEILSMLIDENDAK